MARAARPAGTSPKTRRNPAFFTGWTPNGEYGVGLLRVDVVGHSDLPQDRYLDETLANLRSLIEGQLPKKLARELRWERDGGTFVFNKADHVDALEQMVLFADRVRHLLPMFNTARGTLNRLDPGHDISIRILAHAGSVRDVGGDDPLQGDCLNTLYKREKECGVPGYVVLSDAVLVGSNELRKRCQPLATCDDLGPTYLLDAGITLASIRLDDEDSNELRQWITDALKASPRWSRLLYFGYTNQLLANYLANNLPPTTQVRILVRNWVVEAKEERDYNRSRGPSPSVPPWDKADDIERYAKTVRQSQAAAEGRLQIRFYSPPPLFNGALILDDDDRPVAARIGFLRVEKAPLNGGSPYKLERWPALCLRGETEVDQRLLCTLRSRFDHTWEDSRTYEQVVEQECENPKEAHRIWTFDGRRYLIVYVRRKSPNRRWGVVVHEDAMALRRIERFLQEHQARFEIFLLEVPQDAENWIPDKEHETIAQWPGHVVYICTKTLSEPLRQQLAGQGFPFEFSRSVDDKPVVRDKLSHEELRSPIDGPDAIALDLSLVGKFRRHEGSTGYIVAGLHAMGTWGAAEAITGPALDVLVAQVQKDCFGAIVETVFDPDGRKVQRSAFRHARTYSPAVAAPPSRKAEASP